MRNGKTLSPDAYERALEGDLEGELSALTNQLLEKQPTNPLFFSRMGFLHFEIAKRLDNGVGFDHHVAMAAQCYVRAEVLAHDPTIKANIKMEKIGLLVGTGQAELALAELPDLEATIAATIGRKNGHKRGFKLPGLDRQHVESDQADTLIITNGHLGRLATPHLVEVVASAGSLEPEQYGWPSLGDTADTTSFDWGLNGNRASRNGDGH